MPLATAKPKAAPKPRTGRYWGMEIHNVDHANGTWLEGEEFAYPHGGMTRRCYAVWEDGTKRVVRCGLPDTFYSIPAYGTRRGKHIRGFVSSDEHGFHFTEYQHKGGEA